MTLEQAIQHAREQAEKLSGTPCGERHAQLAGWLSELLATREAKPVKFALSTWDGYIQTSKDSVFNSQKEAEEALRVLSESLSIKVMLKVIPLYCTSPAVPGDYFASLVAKARPSADKAMIKYPQPNYVLLKVAEEAGEVVQAAVHYAENRMSWEQVEGEIVQLMAMLIRLVTEGDQVNGVIPPESCRAIQNSEHGHG